MTVVVIVIAGPTSNLGRLPIDERDNRMVGYAAAFHTVVVDDIA